MGVVWGGGWMEWRCRWQRQRQRQPLGCALWRLEVRRFNSSLCVLRIQLARALIKATAPVPVVGPEERGGSLVYGSTASHNFVEGCQCTKQTLPSNADVQSKRRTSDVFAVGTLMIRRMRWRNMCDSGSLGVSPPDADLSVCIYAL